MFPARLNWRPRVCTARMRSFRTALQKSFSCPWSHRKTSTADWKPIQRIESCSPPRISRGFLSILGLVTLVSFFHFVVGKLLFSKGDEDSLHSFLFEEIILEERGFEFYILYFGNFANVKSVWLKSRRGGGRKVSIASIRVHDDTFSSWKSFNFQVILHRDESSTSCETIETDGSSIYHLLPEKF